MVEFADRKTKCVPIEEVFTSTHEPIILQNLVYVHPIGLAVGQTIPVVPLPGQSDCFSRRLAVIQALQSAAPGDIVSTTITEINPQWIYGIADDGYETRLPQSDTEKLLASCFREKRLRLDGDAEMDRGREDEWLYLHDRIRVQLSHRIDRYIMAARLVIGNSAPPPVDLETTEFVVAPPTAPSSPYEQVLVIDENEDDILMLGEYFQDGGYTFDFVTNQNDLTKWCDSWRRTFLTDNPHSSQRRVIPQILVLICFESKRLDGKTVVDLVSEKLPSCSIVLTHAAEVRHSRNEQKILRAMRQGKDYLGEWWKDSPLDALSALLMKRSMLTAYISNVDQHEPLEKVDYKGVPATVETSLARRITLVNDCTDILEALLFSAGQKAAPCAALLFQIDKRSHTVRIVAEAGDERIVQGFHMYESDLHKSPVRDLAIYRQNSDTPNARESGSRFLWFLDAVGGPNSDLSVLGLRPSSPPHSSCAYAAFIFSKRQHVFSGNTALIERVIPIARRFLEIALAADARAAQGDRYQTLAEQTADLRAIAHEARDHLASSVEMIARCEKAGRVNRADRTKLHGAIARTWTVFSQMLAGTKVEYDQFSPNQSVRLLLQLLDQVNLESGIVTLDTTIDDKCMVSARRLAFDSILRNLVFNAVQQIREYCPGKGSVRIHLSLDRDETGEGKIIGLVEDNGPGIHAKYWDAIFISGKSTRRDGTGLGLAVSRRLSSTVNGTVEIVDSHMYSGSAFRFVLPISDSR